MLRALSRRDTLLAGAVVVLFAGVLPLVALLASSVIIDGRFSWSAYARLLGDASGYATVLAHTAALSGWTAALSLVLGVALGVLLGRTDLPLRRTLTLILTIPLLIPPSVLALCWLDALAPRAVAGWLPTAAGSSPGPLAACTGIMTTALMPIVLIVTIVSLRTVDPHWEEAALLCTGWRQTLRHVTLPAVRPALLLALVIVLLLTAGEVAVPMLLHYPVYPVEILVQYAAFYDIPAAAASAVPVALASVAFTAVARVRLGHRAYGLVAATPGRTALTIPLGRWRWPAAALIAAFAGVTVVIPLAALLHTSFVPGAYAAAWRATAGSAQRSMVLAATGATLLAAVGFICAYAIERRAYRWWRPLETTIAVLFTIPGPLLAIGLIALWNRETTAAVYESAAVLLLAYVAQYCAISTHIAAASLASVPLAREEAAQLCAAPWIDRLRFIVIPATRPGIAAAWIVSFIFCMRDTGATFLLYRPGEDPLPVRIFTLMANGAPSLIAAACVGLIVLDLAMLALLALTLRGLTRLR